jgi:hypothetical protein
MLIASGRAVLVLAQHMPHLLITVKIKMRTRQSFTRFCCEFQRIFRASPDHVFADFGSLIRIVCNCVSGIA